MTTPASNVLVIGYGNPGRLDDGLGPAFAEEVEALQLPNVKVESDYQLILEDAALLAEVDIVLFADASVNATAPFDCRKVKPADAVSFTSHSVSPGQVLHLAQALFKVATEAYVLGIRGYEFNEYMERMSDRAKANLGEAVQFFRDAAENDWAPLRERAAQETSPLSNQPINICIEE